MDARVCLIIRVIIDMLCKRVDRDLKFVFHGKTFYIFYGFVYSRINNIILCRDDDIFCIIYTSFAARKYRFDTTVFNFYAFSLYIIIIYYADVCTSIVFNVVGSTSGTCISCYMLLYIIFIFQILNLLNL